MTAAQRAGRIERATARGLALAGQVHRVAPGAYLVPSQSGGEDHLVVVRHGRLECDPETCKAAAVGQVCCHTGAVGIWLAYFAPAAAPAPALAEAA